MLRCSDVRQDREEEKDAPDSLADWEESHGEG